MTLHVQLMTMLAMIVSGIYIGFALDTYRRLSRVLRRNKVLLYLLEIAFWMFQTLVLFYVLFQMNEGILRIYVFLACLLGYSMYVVLFQKGYRYLLEGIIHAVKVVCLWIYQAFQVLIIQPIYWLFRMLYKVVRGIVMLCFRLLYYPVKVVITWIKRSLPEKLLKKISQIYGSCSTIINKPFVTLKKLWKKWR